MGDTKFNEDLILIQNSCFNKFPQVKEFQSVLRSVSASYKQDLSKEDTRRKKIRRSKRLKDLYLSYFSSLNISPKASKQIFQIKPTVNLKALIDHQTKYLKSKKKHRKKVEMASPPLFSKLKLLFSETSYSVPREATSILISHFPHSAKTFNKKREKLSQIIADKIEKLHSEKPQKIPVISFSDAVKKAILIQHPGNLTKRYRSTDRGTQDSMSTSCLTIDDTQDRSFTSRSNVDKYKRLGFVVFNRV